jgi:hypothetical protein
MNMHLLEGSEVAASSSAVQNSETHQGLYVSIGIIQLHAKDHINEPNPKP